MLFYVKALVFAFSECIHRSINVKIPSHTNH